MWPEHGSEEEGRQVPGKKRETKLSAEELRGMREALGVDPEDEVPIQEVAEALGLSVKNLRQIASRDEDFPPLVRYTQVDTRVSLRAVRELREKKIADARAKREQSELRKDLVRGRPKRGSKRRSRAS